MNKQLTVKEIDREIRKLKKLCAQDKAIAIKLKAKQQALKDKIKAKEAKLKRDKIIANQHIMTIKKLKILAERKGINLDNFGK